MLHCPHCGLLDAPLDSGLCARCGQDPQAAPALAPVRAEGGPAVLALYPLSPLKLIVMSVCTLGLYTLFWFYRNWRLRRELRGREVWPFWRSFFSPLFAYALFQEVRDEAGAHGVEAGWSAGWLALLYFALGVTSRLPDPYWLAALLTFVPLVDVQRTINQANARIPAPLAVDRGFSALNLLGVAVGMAMISLIIAGLMLPPEAVQ